MPFFGLLGFLCPTSGKGRSQSARCQRLVLLGVYRMRIKMTSMLLDQLLDHLGPWCQPSSREPARSSLKRREGQRAVRLSRAGVRPNHSPEVSKLPSSKEGLQDGRTVALPCRTERVQIRVSFGQPTVSYGQPTVQWRNIGGDYVQTRIDYRFAPLSSFVNSPG